MSEEIKAIKLEEDSDVGVFNSKISEGVWLVDFYADWCGPCRKISPYLEQLLKEYPGQFNVLKVNVDDCSDVAQNSGISAMPTFHFYKDGMKKGEVVGASEEKVKKELLKLIS